ncbi:MAG TPA: hypothetical protein HPQ03_02045 [Deltaproteobacteria bacterium]|nr:hypothetical protein [Deltaproteobacteria bacterium]
MMAKYHKTGYYLRILLCLILLLSVTTELWAMKQEGSNKTDSQLTPAQLRSELMNFADRYTQYLSQASIEFKLREPRIHSRQISLSTNFLEASAAFDIAGGQNPDTALLDMVVLVTLQRMVWEEYWKPNWFKKSADVYVETLRRAETDIWKIAEKVLLPSHLQKLRELIDEWHETHPKQWLVSYIRFSDFDEARRASIEKSVKSGGLLAPIKEATEVVDEIRMLGERAMYKLSRMQLLLNLQVQMFLLDVMVQPEVEKILKEVPKFSTVSNRFADAVEKLPDQIKTERTDAINQAMNQLTRFRKETLNQLMNRVTSERKDLINQLMERIATERKAAVHQVLEGVANERKNILNDFVSQDQRLTGLLGELRGTLTQGTELATALNSTVAAANTLAARFDKDTSDPSPPKDDAGIKDYQALVSEASTTVIRLGDLVQTLDKFMGSPNWDKRMPQFAGLVGQVEQESEKLLNRVFWKGTGLILIFLIGSCLTAIVYRLATRKMSH